MALALFTAGGKYLAESHAQQLPPRCSRAAVPGGADRRCTGMCYHCDSRSQLAGLSWGDRHLKTARRTYLLGPLGQQVSEPLGQSEEVDLISNYLSPLLDVGERRFTRNSTPSLLLRRWRCPRPTKIGLLVLGVP